MPKLQGRRELLQLSHWTESQPHGRMWACDGWHSKTTNCSLPSRECTQLCQWISFTPDPA